MALLRQAVLVARDLDAVAGQVLTELGLGEPFRDPGVARFGLPLRRPLPGDHA